MDTTPPVKSTGREIVERAVEAGLGSIPLVGAALAVTFVTALGWRMEQRRERWFTELAEAVEELGERSYSASVEATKNEYMFEKIYLP